MSELFMSTTLQPLDSLDDQISRLEDRYATLLGEGATGWILRHVHEQIQALKQQRHTLMPEG